MKLELDLRGRLRNFKLPASRALVPLYESIVNSLHAIDEVGRANGSITIEVIRGAQTALDLVNQAPVTTPITGFRITDTGIGFNDDNYRSFCTSDSTYKYRLGGHGVGRFTWLKAFSAVHIDSVYETDSRKHQRILKLTVDGIEDNSPAQSEQASSQEALQHVTMVTLEGLQNPYDDALPKRASTIAARVVDHCLLAFRATRTNVRVEVHDGDDFVDVTAMVADVLATSQTDAVAIGRHNLALTHIRINSTEVTNHKLALLANGREVCWEPLARHLPLLRTRLRTDEEGDFWWVTLVESPTLNKLANAERDGFDMPDESDPLYPDMLSHASILSAVLPVIETRAEPYLSPLRGLSKAQCETYVQTRAPEYRHVLALRPEKVASIPPDLTEEKLDAALHQISYEIDVDLRAQGRKLLAELEDVDVAQYDEFISETNAAGKARLAKYVVQRRIVLELLAKSLQRDATGKYSLEEAVHKIIFPLRSTSEDVPYENQNLWVIDERLSYHAYLASDTQLRSMAPLETDSQLRPDLVIFNRPLAFTENVPCQSIVIVEFKRPLRNDYDEESNPIAQVYEYVRRIRDGSENDRHGRPLTIPEQVPFYCYVICDLTSRLRKEAINYTLTPTPDQLGFFGYNPGLRTYIEIISFEKLVDDAAKRNRILFEKLNLPRA